MRLHESSSAPKIIWDLDGEWAAVFVGDVESKEAALSLVERWLETDDRARLARCRQDALSRTTRLMLNLEEDPEIGNSSTVTKECWVVPLIP